MDPRLMFHSPIQQRIENKTFISDNMQNELLCYLGGPLRVHPQSSPYNKANKSLDMGNNHQISRSSIIHMRRNQSPLAKYGSLLMQQQKQQYKKSMIKNPHFTDTTSSPAVKLDISDRERYYFQKMGMYGKAELLERNTKRKYIEGQNYRIKQDIAGKHTLPPDPNRSNIEPYNKYQGFSPKMLNNADEVGTMF